MDTPAETPDFLSHVIATATFAVIETALSILYFWLTFSLGLAGGWWWLVVGFWCLVIPLCWLVTYASAREAFGKRARWLLWGAPLAFQGPILLLMVPYGLIVVCSFQPCDL
jgi:hypothetical protein